MTLDIMMPFYGRFDHLQAAVESVIAQSDPDWRLVVIDDVYPDAEPGEWVKSLTDSRVTYVRNVNNLGVSGNFRRAVDLAENDYVVIMGCDDVMLPGYVSRVKSLAASAPAAAIIQPGVSIIDSEGADASPLADRVKAWLRPKGAKPRVLSGSPLAASLLRGNWTYFPSICWKRDAIARIGFSAKYEVVLDLALQLEIVLEGGSMILDDSTVFKYRRHNASVSSATKFNGIRFAEEQSLSLEVASRARQVGWTAAARAGRLYLTSRLNALSEVPTALRAGNRAGARVLLGHAAGRVPGHD